MGQPIKVSVHSVPDVDVAVFETDRSLTGTETRSYVRSDGASGRKPGDMLAAQFFELPGIMSVSVSSNLVTLRRSPAPDWDHLHWDELLPRISEIIKNLFVYYDVDRAPAASSEQVFHGAPQSERDEAITSATQASALRDHLIAKRRRWGRPARTSRQQGL